LFTIGLQALTAEQILIAQEFLEDQRKGGCLQAHFEDIRHAH